MTKEKLVSLELTLIPILVLYMPLDVCIAILPSAPSLSKGQHIKLKRLKSPRSSILCVSQLLYGGTRM